MLSPIDNNIVSRPKPTLPDKLMTVQEHIYYASDLACWIADKAEALLSGVRDSPEEDLTSVNKESS